MVQAARIFVSHSAEDAAWCRRFVTNLRQKGADVWYDEQSLGYGILRTEIERELRARSIFIVVLSPASISSGWVQREIDAAIHLHDQQPERIILPVVARTCEVPLLLIGFRYISGPHDNGLEPEDAAGRVLLALNMAPADAPSSLPSIAADIVSAQHRPLPAPHTSPSAHRHRLPYIVLAALIILVSLGFVGHLVTSGGFKIYPQPTRTTSGSFAWSGLGTSISMISATEGWAVGTGALLHYHNGAWSTLPAPGADSLLSVYMLPTGDGWAVGNYGVILREMGGQWTAVQGVAGLSAADALHSVFMVSSDEGWAVGNVIVHYISGRWSIVNVPNQAFLRSVFMIASDDGWAVGDSGAMLHYHNGRWTATARITSANLNGVYMLSHSEGWAVGAGVLLHYLNGVWTTIAYAPQSIIQIYDVFMVSSIEGWAVGSGGAIFHYVDGNWMQFTSPAPSDLRSVFMVSSTNGWAVGASGALLHYDGIAWRAYHPPA